MIVEGIIFGPEDSEWEGGVFRIMMTFSEEYPSKAPKVKFLTKMFHPNIYKNGDICLNILDKDWAPTFDCTSILLSVQSLLNDPNVDSPANKEAAQLYRERINLESEYFKRVRECVF